MIFGEICKQKFVSFCIAFFVLSMLTFQFYFFCFILYKSYSLLVSSSCLNLMSRFTLCHSLAVKIIFWLISKC